MTLTYSSTTKKQGRVLGDCRTCKAMCVPVSKKTGVCQKCADAAK